MLLLGLGALLSRRGRLLGRRAVPLLLTSRRIRLGLGRLGGPLLARLGLPGRLLVLLAPLRLLALLLLALLLLALLLRIPWLLLVTLLLVLTVLAVFAVFEANALRRAAALA